MKKILFLLVGFFVLSIYSCDESNALPTMGQNLENFKTKEVLQEKTPSAKELVAKAKKEAAAKDKQLQQVKLEASIAKSELKNIKQAASKKSPRKIVANFTNNTHDGTKNNAYVLKTKHCDNAKIRRKSETFLTNVKK